MEVYDILLKEINTNLNKADIENNNEQISLYELYERLNKKFELLRSVKAGESVFTNKELFKRKNYKQIHFIENNQCSEIWIYPTSDIFQRMTIAKDRDSDNIYLDTHRDSQKTVINKFVKKYYDEIMKIFAILEEYYDLKSILKKNYEFKYKNYLFKIIILDNGKLDFDIEMIDNHNDKTNMKDIYKRNYYGKKQLLEIIKENKFELAKKVPIYIELLDEPLQEIVFQNAENPKTKGYGCGRL